MHPVSPGAMAPTSPTSPRVTYAQSRRIGSSASVETRQSFARRHSRNPSLNAAYLHPESPLRSPADSTSHDHDYFSRAHSRATSRAPSQFGKASVITTQELDDHFETYPTSVQESVSHTGSLYGVPGWRGPSIAGRGRPYFRSRRIKKGETYRPELEEYDKMEIWVTIIPVIGILMGLGIIAVLTWYGIYKAPNHKYCSVFYDDFTHGWNPHIWQQEVQCGGYDDGYFEVTTPDNQNAFVRDGHLVIKATKVNDSLIEVDSITNLTADGTCTSTWGNDCVIVSNVTAGHIVNPVQSARINTKKSIGITYGKVEVRAKLASGDWLVPSIWMLPVNYTYGPWPRSGEIDIAMARGNNYTYQAGGINKFTSTLHWGPESNMDGWWRTNKNQTALHTTWASDYNTFGLEWSEKYLFTYVNTRLMSVLYTTFDKPLFKLGNFDAVNSNGSMVDNPWSHTGRLSTPFDQEFYLIVSLAVGGRSGFFVDEMGGKPWSDSSKTARYDFWSARDQWYPTWEEGGAEMVIERVQMWRQCD